MKRSPSLAHWATLAAALAALPPASAQSVQLNGVVDLMLGQRQLSGADKVRRVDSGGMTTSRWGLEGSEDLGDGLLAQFALSGFLRADTGEAGRFGSADGGWRRMAYVGLQGRNWGVVRLGRNGTPTFSLAVRFNPFADSTALAPYMLHMYPGGQPLAAPMNGPDSAADNSIAWLSPSWSGFSVSALYAFGETAASSQNRWAAGANWSSGPLTLAVATEQSRVAAGLPAGVSKLADVQLGASYALPVAKLFAQWASTKLDIAAGSRDYRTWQLGAMVPAGGLGHVLLSYAASSKSEPALADVKRRTLGVGYDYYLSRRTDMYAVLLSDKVSARSRGTTAVAGIRHRF
jgi:predicted porin